LFDEITVATALDVFSPLYLLIAPSTVCFTTCEHSLTISL